MVPFFEIFAVFTKLQATLSCKMSALDDGRYDYSKTLYFLTIVGLLESLRIQLSEQFVRSSRFAIHQNFH